LTPPQKRLRLTCNSSVRWKLKMKETEGRVFLLKIGSGFQ
jgi:hypothetical protein